MGDTESATGKGLLFDLAALRLDQVAADRRAIERVNPHRHEMALLDGVIWHAADMSSAVAYLDVRPDMFWVRGHFPTRPTMPGVVMIECGAQLASFVWNSRQPTPRVAAFLRIEDAVFRRAVVPGERLHILCREVKCTPRRFITNIQGAVDGQVAFSARITGMAMEEHREG